MSQILLIDGDAQSCQSLTQYLGARGLVLTCAGDGVTGLARGIKESYDIVILDAMVPRLDSFEVLRGLRRHSSVPVIMLSAGGGQEDRIQALERGADDCLAKPFLPLELLARMRAILRRSRLRQREAVVRLERLSVDVESRTALVLDEPLPLTSTEFDILDVLARAAGRIVSRDEITRRLYQRDSIAYDRSLDVHISHLRRKLTRARGPMIRTIHGIGYLLARDEP